MKSLQIYYDALIFESMNITFEQNLKYVTTAHFAILGVLIALSSFHGCLNTREIHQTPIFMVAMELNSPKGEENTKSDAIEIKKPDKKEDKKKEDKKKEDKKVDKKDFIKTVDSNKKNVKKNDKLPPNKIAPRDPVLSEEEINKWLAQGATVGEINIKPEDTAIAYEMIKKAFYSAWNQPSYAEVGNRSVEIVIKLDAAGNVIYKEITKRSGIQSFDDSVQQAMSAVIKIENLPDKFAGQTGEIPIEFNLKPEGM